MEWVSLAACVEADTALDQPQGLVAARSENVVHL